MRQLIHQLIYYCVHWLWLFCWGQTYSTDSTEVNNGCEPLLDLITMSDLIESNYDELNYLLLKCLTNETLVFRKLIQCENHTLFTFIHSFCEYCVSSNCIIFLFWMSLIIRCFCSYSLCFLTHYSAECETNVRTCWYWKANTVSSSELLFSL